MSIYCRLGQWDKLAGVTQGMDPNRHGQLLQHCAAQLRKAGQITAAKQVRRLQALFLRFLGFIFSTLLRLGACICSRCVRSVECHSAALAMCAMRGRHRRAHI